MEKKEKKKKNNEFRGGTAAFNFFIIHKTSQVTDFFFFFIKRRIKKYIRTHICTYFLILAKTNKGVYLDFSPKWSLSYTINCSCCPLDLHLEIITSLLNINISQFFSSSRKLALY